MADKNLKQNIEPETTPNVAFIKPWTQSDEFAVYVERLQESRQKIKYCRNKFGSPDTWEKKDAQGILKKLYQDTCEAIAEIDTLRAKTEPVKCKHWHRTGDVCQDCNKTLYDEPDIEEKTDSQT